MRKLIAGLFISLDGVAESPDQWQFDVFNDEMGEIMGTIFSQQDAILMGRVTYQEWTGYWPTSKDEPIAGIINNMPKYIASTTLSDVSWGDFKTVTLLKGDITQEINKLKALPGKNIGIGGSISLTRSLINLGLIDELQLIIHPVIVNKGKKLFQDGDPLQRLTLVDSRTTKTGVISAIYAPRK